MKNNIRLSAFFAVLAVLVAGIGIESSGSGDASVRPEAATSWATAFPVAQAGFSLHQQAN